MTMAKASGGEAKASPPKSSQSAPSMMRILVIFAGPLMPVVRGNQVRTLSMIAYLRRQGFAVDLACLLHKAQPPEVLDQHRGICDAFYPLDMRPGSLRDHFHFHCEKMAKRYVARVMYISPFHESAPRSVQARIRELCTATPYLCVILNYVHFTPVLEAVPREAIVRVVDTHDVICMRERTLDACRHRRGFSYERVRATERALLMSHDAAIGITQGDVEALRAMAPSLDHILASVTLPVQTLPQCAQEYDLLFVGSGTRGPNVDALQWFNESIWPRLRGHCPNLKVAVVGIVGASKYARRLDSRVYKLLGVVDSVMPAYAQARVVIAPLRAGGGMKVKVLEAMSVGKAVVGTTIAGEGIGLQPGVHAHIEDDAAGFAEKVALLLDNDGVREAMESAAREFVAARYNEEAVYRGLVGYLMGLGK